MCRRHDLCEPLCPLQNMGENDHLARATALSRGENGIVHVAAFSRTLITSPHSLNFPAKPRRARSPQSPQSVDVRREMQRRLGRPRAHCSEAAGPRLAPGSVGVRAAGPFPGAGVRPAHVLVTRRPPRGEPGSGTGAGQTLCRSESAAPPAGGPGPAAAPHGAAAACAWAAADREHSSREPPATPEAALGVRLQLLPPPHVSRESGGAESERGPWRQRPLPPLPATSVPRSSKPSQVHRQQA